MELKKTIISIDIGSLFSGITTIKGNMIGSAKMIHNEEILLTIYQESINEPVVDLLIEDVQPYKVQMTPHLIATAKWLGRLEYQLTDLKVPFKLILRSQVKEWVFNTFPDIAMKPIWKRIIKEDLRYKTGDLRKPHFVYVNDAIIAEAMRQHWKIDRPMPGKSGAYGLKSHLWQALAIGTMWMEKESIRLSGCHAHPNLDTRNPETILHESGQIAPIFEDLES